MKKMKAIYKRVLLKISGEALLGEKSFGIDYQVLDRICQEILEIKKLDLELIIVVGAGNIWRGGEDKNAIIDRVPSDFIGMMGTIMNAVAIQSSLESKGLDSRIASALDVPAVAEPYIRRRVLQHLEKNRVVVCAAGTGNPFFTTDSAAALRALELDCDIVLKATNIDGVYDADPRTNPQAKKYDEVTFDEVLERRLKVMDSTAIAQCRDNNMPIIIFELMKAGNIKKIICGEKIGTKVVI